MKRDFKNAIEDYLKICKELNKEPEKQCKGSLNIRLGVELHNKVKMKSIENYINELIKNAVSDYLKMN